MSLLLFSPKCSHSLDLIDFINQNAQLRQIVNFHNINTHGIPPQYKYKIDRVPTMLTKNGKLLVGQEIKNWLESLLPQKQVETFGFGGCGMTTLDGDGVDEIFELDSYGSSLQPGMTPELQAKIDQDVNRAYDTSLKK